MLNNRQYRSTAGNAMVEFAIALPFMFLVVMGAADFGRLFFESTALANSAQAGTMYGTQTNAKSGDTAGIEAAALADAVDVQSAVAVPNRFCDCPDSPGTSVNCLTGTCTNYGLPRVYVRTRMEKNFQTLGVYPGVPSNSPIVLENWMRVR